MSATPPSKRCKTNNIFSTLHANTHGKKLLTFKKMFVCLFCSKTNKQTNIFLVCEYTLLCIIHCYAIQMTYTILVGDIAKIYIGTSSAGGQGKGNETD